MSSGILMGKDVSSPPTPHFRRAARTSHTFPGEERTGPFPFPSPFFFSGAQRLFDVRVYFLNMPDFPRPLDCALSPLPLFPESHRFRTTQSSIDRCLEASPSVISSLSLGFLLSAVQPLLFPSLSPFQEIECMAYVLQSGDLLNHFLFHVNVPTFPMGIALGN